MEASSIAQVAPQKPMSVRVAMWIYWATTAFWVVWSAEVMGAIAETASDAVRDDMAMRPGLYLAIWALVVLGGGGLWALLALKISAGRNWARIVALLSYLSRLWNMLFGHDEPSPFLLELMADFMFALEGVALLLLFTLGSSWFRKKPRPLNSA